MKSWRSLLEAPADGNHIVQVYEDDDFLVDALSHFVGSGLARGEGVVLFVAPRHWEACLRRLGAHRVAPHDAELRGQLAVINARTALARLMVDGMPDWKTFQDLVGTVINLTRRKYPRVRAFGEMVDLLWQHGERAAALRLEELWNHMIKVQSLTLCCAYRMDPLDGDAVQNVCRQHSHLLPAHDYEQLEARVGRASDAVLGTGIARLVRDLAAARRPSTEMPAAQAMLLWMKEHMPISAEKVLSRLRAGRRRKAMPVPTEA